MTGINLSASVEPAVTEVYVTNMEQVASLLIRSLGFSPQEEISFSASANDGLKLYNRFNSYCLLNISDNLSGNNIITIITDDCLRDFYKLSRAGAYTLQVPRYQAEGLEASVRDHCSNTYQIVERRDYAGELL